MATFLVNIFSIYNVCKIAGNAILLYPNLFICFIYDPRCRFIRLGFFAEFNKFVFRGLFPKKQSNISIHRAVVIRSDINREGNWELMRNKGS